MNLTRSQRGCVRTLCGYLLACCPRAPKGSPKLPTPVMRAQQRHCLYRYRAANRTSTTWRFSLFSPGLAFQLPSPGVTVPLARVA